MKFSTKIQAQIRTSFVEGLAQHFAEQPEVTVMEIETTLRAVLLEVGVQCLGAYLSSREERYPPPQIECRCGGHAEYQFRREAKVKSVMVANGELRYVLYGGDRGGKQEIVIWLEAACSVTPAFSLEMTLYECAP